MNYAGINECFTQFIWSSLNIANVASGECRRQAESEILHSLSGACRNYYIFSFLFAYIIYFPYLCGRKGLNNGT